MILMSKLLILVPELALTKLLLITQNQTGNSGGAGALTRIICDFDVVTT